ncbi:MAG TPA: hypothetical protein P5267_02020 [Patescibacteria group bacterium]|nr:hypothetical protein [Patescibacteria group bacterium]
MDKEGSIEYLSPEERGRLISSRVDEILDILRRAALNEFPEDQRWDTALPLISVILASTESYEGQRFNFGSFNELLNSKPLKGKDCVEMGFGLPQEAHLLVLPKFGARVWGIEPDNEAVRRIKGWIFEEENLDDGGQPLLLSDNIKTGEAGNLADIFPGKRFDILLSSRVLEEYPMSGAGSIESGIKKAKQFLSKTFSELNDGGLSIHTTTQDFLIDDRASLGEMGYEVPVLNNRFSNDGGGDVYYYTVLKKIKSG